MASIVRAFLPLALIRGWEGDIKSAIDRRRHLLSLFVAQPGYSSTFPPAFLTAMGLFIGQSQAFFAYMKQSRKTQTAPSAGLKWAAVTLATPTKSAMIFHNFGKTRPPTVTRSKIGCPKKQLSCADPVPYQNGETLAKYSLCDSQ